MPGSWHVRCHAKNPWKGGRFMLKGFPCIVLLLLAGPNLFAQSAESDESTRGFIFYERFQSSINTLGAVNALDSSVGYKFNSHISVDGGIPIYFVRPSSATASATGVSASNGIGNVYGQ